MQISKQSWHYRLYSKLGMWHPRSLCMYCQKLFWALLALSAAIPTVVIGMVTFPIMLYLGIANEMKDMLPMNYDRKSTTQILFESNGNKIHMKYDEILNALEIGNSNFQKAARENDAIYSAAVNDPVFWTWLAAAGVVLAGLGVVPPIPTSLTGIINAGSDQVKIGDK